VNLAAEPALYDMVTAQTENIAVGKLSFYEGIFTLIKNIDIIV